MALIFDPKPEFSLEWKDGAVLHFKRPTMGEEDAVLKKINSDPKTKDWEQGFKTLKKVEETLISWDNIHDPKGSPLPFTPENRETVATFFFNTDGTMEKWAKGMKGPLFMPRTGTISTEKPVGAPESVKVVKESVKSGG